MIVHRLKLMCPAWIAELSASPVTRPGSAIGRTSRNDTASRPKNLKRCTAKAASDPSTSAAAVAPKPARTDADRADRTSELCQTTVNHFVVSPAGGQACPIDELNAERKMTPTGP